MRKPSFIWIVYIETYFAENGDEENGSWFYPCLSYKDAQHCLEEEYNSTKQEDRKEYGQSVLYTIDNAANASYTLEVANKYMQRGRIFKKYFYDPEKGVDYDYEKEVEENEEPTVKRNYLDIIFRRKRK